MMNTVLREDEEDGASYRPIIAIGHSKDLVDFKTVESFLSYLKKNNISVSTMGNAYQRCLTEVITEQDVQKGNSGAGNFLRKGPA
jgi:hypothetical protein